MNPVPCPRSRRAGAGRTPSGTGGSRPRGAPFSAATPSPAARPEPLPPEQPLRSRRGAAWPASTGDRRVPEPVQLAGLDRSLPEARARAPGSWEQAGRERDEQQRRDQDEPPGPVDVEEARAEKSGPRTRGRRGTDRPAPESWICGRREPITAPPPAGGAGGSARSASSERAPYEGDRPADRGGGGRHGRSDAMEASGCRPWPRARREPRQRRDELLEGPRHQQDADATTRNAPETAAIAR